MNKDIKVGKYILESLTTGMYNTPHIIYREYIQNAVDSLENAMAEKIINKEEARIEILVDESTDYIKISDNGLGINTSKAFEILTNIGNSTKRYSMNRGFRGIGRLGGLSYCDTLRFTTSSKGETVKSIIEFNCKKLKQLLIPDVYEEYDLSQVMNVVTEYSQEEESKEDHYFIVELLGVASYSELLDMDEIESYIRQTAPITYQKKFIWKSKIYEMFQENHLELSEFPIYLGTDEENLKQIFKPNTDKFIADKKKKMHDALKGIREFYIKDKNEILAIGWFGISELYGQIVDEEVKGLRLRKGNILIGDKELLTRIFNDDRFNGYIQGEVFVLSNRLIPNARRDDFEHNEAYENFIYELTQEIGIPLSKTVRESSTRRNDKLQKKLNEAENKIAEVIELESDGFNSKQEKEKHIEKLTTIYEQLAKIPVKELEEQEKKQKVLEKLDQIIDKSAESNSYKVNNIKDIGKKEKKVLKIVTEVLTDYLTSDTLGIIIKEIENQLRRGGSK